MKSHLLFLSAFSLTPDQTAVFAQFKDPNNNANNDFGGGKHRYTKSKKYNKSKSSSSSPQVGKKGLERGNPLSRSFRKMTDAVVHLRPKAGADKRLERTPSARSKLLSRFFEDKASEADRRKSKEELVRKGIYKSEAVFGNDLVGMPKDLEGGSGLPEFLVRAVRKVESLMTTVGVYRINGDSAVVQKIRYKM